MIDYIHKDLYWQDSIDKQLKIELEDGTILDNSMIYSEEFELEESVCSEDELRFGACEASCVKFRIFSIPNRLVGQKINISEVLGGQTDSPMQIGKYKIASAKPTADRDFIDIVAYDVMYDIIHSDVAEWYNNQFKATTSTTTDEDGNETTVVTYSTTTLKKFRDSLFLHFGIEQVDVTLPNDNMVVSKTIEIVPNEDGTIGETLSGSMVIEAICEINGCFGHINRDGKFEYVTLQQISKELFPADDLFPRNDLYPASDNVGLVIYNWQYEATEYEDFDVQPITQVQIIQEDNDIGMTVGADGNKYVVNSNFLTYSLSDAELETVGTNILSVIEKAKYTPIKANVIGNPCVTVGDIIKIVTNSAILYSYVINRSLKGCQSLTDEFESNGEEYRSVDVNSTSGQIKKLQGRSNVLERSIDETRMTITNVEKGLKNEIKVTADGIEKTITKTTNELKTYADNAASTAESNANSNTAEQLKSYPTKTEMKTEISASAESITSIVSSTQSKWDDSAYINSGAIPEYGYGEPTSTPTSNFSYYLDVTSGWMYKGMNSSTSETGYIWEKDKQLKEIKNVLSSKIEQTAESITSTVASSQNKYDTKDSPTISLYGYGYPTYNATNYDKKRYLDQSTGNVYLSKNGTWLITERLPLLSEVVQSEIEQTAESITSTVSKSQSKYDTQGTDVDYYGYGNPTYDGTEYYDKHYLDQTTGNLYFNQNGNWEFVKTLPLITEELSSRIEQAVDSIVLKVDSNGRIVEVALTGDPKDGTEFTVDADNISLTASDIIDIIANNSINLTSKNISIDSYNFSLDEYGNMKCNDGEFSGTVKASDIYAKNGLKMYVDTWKPDNPPAYKTILAIYKYSANLRDVFQLQVGLNLDEVALPSTVTLGFANKFVIGSMYSNNSNVANITNISYYYGLTTPAIGFESLGNQNFFIAVNASDTKLKKNMIETEMTSLDKIKRIEFIQFDWKDSGIHVPLGVSANQLEEIIPQAVYNVKQPEESEYDSLKNIDTTSLLNYSLKAIQELSEVVDSQREEIDTLKQNLATLTERMDRHEQGLQ